MDIYKTFLKLTIMDIRNILILSMVKNIGPAFIKKNRALLSQENSCEAFIKEFRPKEVDSLVQYAKTADDIISDCKSNDIKMISILDDAYPSQLAEIGDPPSVIFLKGDELLLNYVMGIIGTRKSSNLGNRIAEHVGAYFSQQFSICNGLVEGIDEHAIYHNGQISKKVVGIISGGLIYNETCTVNHAKIIDGVLNAGGLIISEFYPRQKEDKFSGSKASRIQAGLSHGLILIQSKINGGSKYTLKNFSKLGRPIGVIHYPASEEYDTELFGANRIIAEKGIEGLAQMIGIKKISSINIGKIITLTGQTDYGKLIQEINSNNNRMLF